MLSMQGNLVFGLVTETFLDRKKIPATRPDSMFLFLIEIIQEHHFSITAY